VIASSRITVNAFLLIAVMLVTAACASAPTAAKGDGDSLPHSFALVLRNYEVAWSAKDATALAALFAEDGYVLPNGRPPVRGSAAIEQHYQGAGRPLHLTALTWAQEGSIGYIIGAYTHEPPPPDWKSEPATARGKFTLTLVRKPGSDRWLIMSDMDSSNSRPKSQ
jgi:ketosteroid isomerase-like protein